MVGLATDITPDSLDELSDADLEVLGETWMQFGHLDQWQLEKHTHDNCPEWEDPDGSQFRSPIRAFSRCWGSPTAKTLSGA